MTRKKTKREQTFHNSLCEFATYLHELSHDDNICPDFQHQLCARLLAITKLTFEEYLEEHINPQHPENKLIASVQ